jgi:outer membrane receptor protein involved in Fe transport
MKAPRLPYGVSTAAAALALLAARATAQTVTGPAGTPAEPGEVVTLNAFSVTADESHGYIASESVTGTRIASKIADLPFGVNVVTSQFLNDFQAFNLNDALAFVSGFSPSEIQGQFQLRGFASPTTLVDGFRRIGLIDTVDIARIEVIKGAAASIYGAVQPGGAVNILTPQPTTTPRYHAEFGGGTDDFYRAALSASGPAGVSDRLFYRIDMANSFNKYSEQFSSQHKAYIAAKLLFKPDAETNVTLSIEHSELYEHPFNQELTVTEKQTMPWAGNSITESQYYGLAGNGLLNYNYGGPESYDHNRVTSATLALEHRFNEVWSLKLGVNAFVNPYNDQLIGSGAYYPYGTGNVTPVNGIITQAFTPEVKDQPQADWKPQRGGGMQLDDLFSFKVGPFSNKLLITADYYELTQRTVTLSATYAGAQATDYYALYSPYNPAGAPYYTPQTTWNPATLGYGWNTTMYGQNPAVYGGATTDQYVAASDYGVFGSERLSFFQDRVNLLAGGRWDYVKNQVKNYNIAANGTAVAVGSAEPATSQAFDYNTAAYTYQLGGSVRITDTLNAYANKSSAFNPQPQLDSYTGQPLPNNKSNGYEYGFKASFLHNQLNFTVDRFEINEYNLVQSETDPVSGLKDTILTGQQQAKGYELDFNYQVTNDFIIGGDWGYTKAQVVNANALTFLNGLPARRVPRDNVGSWARYQISHGVLRGVFFLADFKYYSKSLVNLGSGKSLIPGPAGTTVGSAGSMYYVAATNTTYATGTDPKIAGEQKITSTPVINAPFPGNGLLPYPNLPAGATINTPVGLNGLPLPQAGNVAGVYTGAPTGVFVDDGRQNIFNAPSCVVDFGTGYSWRNGRRFVSTARISLKNLLNRAYTYGSGVPGAPFQVVGTYSLDF